MIDLEKAIEMREFIGLSGGKKRRLALHTERLQCRDSLGAGRNPIDHDVCPTIVRGGLVGLLQASPCINQSWIGLIPAAPIVTGGLHRKGMLLKHRVRDALLVLNELDDLVIKVAHAMRLAGRRTPLHQLLDARQVLLHECQISPRQLLPGILVVSRSELFL